MNATPDSIIVNSCQYTPVYLIQDPGASQGQSYFIAQSNVEEPKPVNDNLKAFYESSGNIENSFVCVNSSPKPRILKKLEGGVVGNNLKLASFLLPKNDTPTKHQYIVNNVVLKPNVTVTTATAVSHPAPTTVNTVPRLNIDSKIVKLKDVALKTRNNRVERASPKPKPKEIKEIPTIITPAPSKHTSVQLLKLGETYHSLNQLSDEQMKMVTQALKIFSNPEKIAPEPAYDPVTNTKFIYKVVSPRDLTVVGKNKVIRKETKPDSNMEGILKTDVTAETVIHTEPRKDNITKDTSFPKKENIIKDVLKKERKENIVKDALKKETVVKDLFKKDILGKEIKKDNGFRNEVKKEINTKKIEDRLLKQKIMRELEEEQEMRELEEEQEMAEEIEASEPKVTRSGRKVKLPKIKLSEGTPYRPKKKSTFVNCFQCSDEFSSLYRLQKHYESHPTHIPAKIHSNLFHCLLAIVKSGTEEDRTNIFIQQLEQLIVKLRSLLPCMLKSTEEGQSCTISEDVGRLLGMEPGKCHLDIEALSCDKNKDGYCSHSPPPKDIKPEPNSQSWITMNNEDIMSNVDIESEDCARTNSVEKWPTVNKRVWKQKQQKSENAKRMRLASENCDTVIELGMDDLIVLDKPVDCLQEEPSAIAPSASSEQINKADSLVVKNECNHVCELPKSTDIIEQALDPSFIPHSAIVQPCSKDEKKQSNHAQFHSAHFNIRSSPIKPTSTVFRKFQINPELLAKYEAQIIRSFEPVDKDHERDKVILAPPDHNVNSQSNENVLQTSRDILQMNENSLQSSEDILQTNENVLQTSEQVLQTNIDSSDTLNNCHVPSLVNTNDDTLQEIFRDEDLSAVKESFILDRELKDWILNRSNDEKSEDGFSRPNSLIEPALLHVRDDEIKQLNIGQKVDLPINDNHDESSVLNFLETLGNDCLSYPGTEIRTNNGDFQLDLFSFHSS